MSTVQRTFAYPGGKSRCVRRIVPHFPTDFTEYREPFIGGGSIAVNLMRRYPKAKYWINDLFLPVYCMWKNLRDRPVEMVKWLFKLKETLTMREAYLFSERTMLDSDEFEMGCKYMVLLKTSWGSLGMRAGKAAPFCDVDNPRFSDASIIHLLDVAKVLEQVDVEITNSDYSKCIGGEGALIYADPPYDIERNDLYGYNGELHRRFNHAELSQAMKGCRHRWLLSYNDNENIRGLYADFFMVPIDLAYSMKNCKGQELLIANFELL